MHVTMIHLSALVTIAITVSLVSCSFDCNNPGYSCRQGTCHYFGVCECPNQFVGVDCSIPRANVTTGAACSVTCHNNGICYNGDMCACTADYTGDLCHLQTTGARCTFDAVVYEAYRPTGFEGETYLKQSRSCKLLETHSDVPGMRKFERKIFHADTSECAPQKVLDLPNPGDVTYEADLISSYKYNSWSLRDTVDNVKCQSKQTLLGISKDAPDSLFPIKMSARDGSSSNVQATTQNAPIALLFAPQNIPDVKGALVDYLEVYSINSTSKAMKSVVLVDNGCAQPNNKYNVGVSNLDELDPATNIWIGLVKMQAFIIIENEPLLFNYRLRFCPARCTAPTCSSAAAPPAANPPV